MVFRNATQRALNERKFKLVKKGSNKMLVYTNLFLAMLINMVSASYPEKVKYITMPRGGGIREGLQNHFRLELGNLLNL